MTPKQDKTYTRTASELERKYGFGKTFAEILGIAEDAQDAALEAQKNVTELDENLTQDEIFNRLTKNGEVKGIYRDDEGNIYINADYIKTGTILADLIKAGVIRSKDGSSVVINLDAGEVDITGTFTTKTADDGSGNRCRTRIVSDGIIMQKTDSYGESSLSNLTSTAMILNGDSGRVSASANSTTADATISVFGSYDGSFGEVLSRADGQKALADIILRNPSLSTKLVIRSQNERNYITGLTAPVDAVDAVNKEYVDNNFAPAGYGEGGYSLDAPYGDPDYISVGCNFSCSQNCPAEGVWVGIYIAGSATNGVMEMQARTGSAVGSVVRRAKIDGVWQPWEWVNPPLAVGVEYRTTKRYQGLPVYTKYISCGTLPVGSASGPMTARVEIGINHMNVINWRIHAVSTDELSNLPVVSNGEIVADAWLSNQALYLRSWRDYSSHYVHTTIEYVK